MSTIELKNHGDRKKLLSHIRNLVALSYADGKFSDEERQYVANVANEAGLTAEEMKQIIDDPESIRFIMPANDIEKIEHLLKDLSVQLREKLTYIIFCLKLT